MRPIEADSMIVLDTDGELTLDDLPEDAGVKPHGLPGASSASSRSTA